MTKTYLAADLNTLVNFVFLLLAIALLFVVFNRHWGSRVQEIRQEIREKSGSWWVLVRLGMAVPITALLVHYKEWMSQAFSWFPTWVGQDLLAFLAITFAIVQFLDAREGEKDLRSIERDMERVVNKISTRGIGTFPDNLDDIVALIRNARNSVQILVDFPGYGLYSEPEMHQDYLAALKMAASREKVMFQMISYDDVLTREESKMELPADLSTLRKEDRAKLDRYLAANKILPAEAPRTRAQLETMLREQQNKNVTDLNAAIKHADHLQQKYLTERAPLFLWLVDRKEAVFTFKNLEKNDQAYSIRTTDGWLVNNLAVYFEHTLARASETFLRKPSYRLTNITQTLTNGAVVTIKGRVDEAEGALVVESIA